MVQFSSFDYVKMAYSVGLVIFSIVIVTALMFERKTSVSQQASPIVAFVVIIIGGIGSIKGAFLAAVLVGLIDTMGRSFLDTLLKLVISDQNAETAAPALSAMLIYILMAAILAFQPQGLFPPKGR